MTVGITGIGSYLPARTLSNADVAAGFGKTAQWIEDKTGVVSRQVAGTGESVVDMGAAAADRALRDAGVRPGDVGMIITASSTHGRLVPSVACGVQRAVKAHAASAYDVNAACAGFLYGLHCAHAFLRSGLVRGPVLVVGAERFSRHLDYGDRRTASLFGDGAGAVVLDDVAEPYGLLHTGVGSDGRQEDNVRVVPDAHRSADPYTLLMDGPATRAFIEARMPAMLDDIKRDTDFGPADFDVVIPHQANMRLLGGILAEAGVSPAQTWWTGHRYGNTGAASVPITLDSARLAGRLTEGALVLLAALGAGMTWATAVLRWRPIPVQPSTL